LVAPIELPAAARSATAVAVAVVASPDAAEADRGPDASAEADPALADAPSALRSTVNARNAFDEVVEDPLADRLMVARAEEIDASADTASMELAVSAVLLEAALADPAALRDAVPDAEASEAVIDWPVAVFDVAVNVCVRATFAELTDREMPKAACEKLSLSAALLADATDPLADLTKPPAIDARLAASAAPAAWRLAVRMATPEEASLEIEEAARAATAAADATEAPADSPVDFLGPAAFADALDAAERRPFAARAIMANAIVMEADRVTPLIKRTAPPDAEEAVISADRADLLAVASAPVLEVDDDATLAELWISVRSPERRRCVGGSTGGCGPNTGRGPLSPTPRGPRSRRSPFSG
jgi:hypothetical protein